MDQQQLAEQLLAQAQEQGVEPVGPGGLLNQLTKRVLETALEAEMSEHLGYEKHHPAGRNRENSRNGPTPTRIETSGGDSSSLSFERSRYYGHQVRRRAGRRKRSTGQELAG